MITVRTVVVAEASARANMMETLGGRGAPAGVVSCLQRGTTVCITFDDERTASRLIDLLIAVSRSFVPQAAAPLDDAELVSIAARGLAEPALSAAHVIETYLP